MSIEGITLEEEIVIAERIQAGRLAVETLLQKEQAYNLGHLSKSEFQAMEQRLKSVMREAEQAKQTLIEKHLYLSSILTKQFKTSAQKEDREQDAALSLVEAVEKWDCNPTVSRFSAYAYKTIQCDLRGNWAKTSLLSFSRFYGSLIGKVLSIDRAIENNISNTTVPIRQRLIAEELRVPVSKIEEVYRMAQEIDTCSLDVPLTDDSDDTLADVIAVKEPTCENPEKIISRFEVQKTVAEVLASLEEQEEKVIRYRFGFVDGKSHTPKEVAYGCYLSPQEELCIETRAMRRLRHPLRSQRLIGLL